MNVKVELNTINNEETVIIKSCNALSNNEAISITIKGVSIDVNADKLARAICNCTNT